MVKVEIEIQNMQEMSWLNQFVSALSQYRAAGSPPKPEAPPVRSAEELAAEGIAAAQAAGTTALAEAKVVGHIAPKLTMEDVVAAASAYFNKNNDVAANYALLKTFGVNRVTELTPDKWAAFYAAVTK